MKFLFLNKKNSTKVLLISSFSFALIFCQISCKKLVENDPPPNAIVSATVYTTDATAAAVLTGVYTKMANNGFAFATGLNSISVLAGLYSDELTLFGGTSNGNSTLVRYYTNNLSSSADVNPWQGTYQCLIAVNTAIENLSNSTPLTPSVKQQLIGEAKFIRAFCYFYLVNFYDDVPLALTSDYRTNSNLRRTEKSDVYQQIITDLKDAQNLLNDTYLDATLKASSSERVRPTKWAATALLSRVYLYTGDWVNAEAQASVIISNNSFFTLSTLNNAFLKASAGNQEAIWQLQPVNSGWNTEDARVFVLNTTPSGSKPVYLDTLLVKSFETGDLRRTVWVKDTIYSGKPYSYPTKYKIAKSGSPVTEYLMVLRLAEQYLIRAEARAQQNKLPEAIADLDKIRQRAGLSLIALTNPGISKPSLLTAILHERQVELFTEWGHRWLDLKRTNNVDAVMSIVTPLKGGTWRPYKALYPIPSYDLMLDRNLVQNSGY
jgi:hypothetical protein